MVSAYDRLVARGLVESRSSSGFFVAARRDDRGVKVAVTGVAEGADAHVVGGGDVGMG